jgi:predicted transcriptional regulator
MQTMEQALADLAIRRVINLDAAFEHTNRRDILAGILERAGLDVTAMLLQLELNPSTLSQQPAGGLRIAGSQV